jgi:hypothetical protein
MASAPDPITSPPDVVGQPWDATSSETVAGWETVDVKSGPANMQGTVAGDFEDGPGPWRQT